jgi:hypothetical protein
LITIDTVNNNNNNNNNTTMVSSHAPLDSQAYGKYGKLALTNREKRYIARTIARENASTERSAWKLTKRGEEDFARAARGIARDLRRLTGVVCRSANAVKKTTAQMPPNSHPTSPPTSPQTSPPTTGPTSPPTSPPTPLGGEGGEGGESPDGRAIDNNEASMEDTSKDCGVSGDDGDVERQSEQPSSLSLSDNENGRRGVKRKYQDCVSGDDGHVEGHSEQPSSLSLSDNDNGRGGVKRQRGIQYQSSVQSPDVATDQSTDIATDTDIAADQSSYQSPDIAADQSSYYQSPDIAADQSSYQSPDIAPDQSSYQSPDIAADQSSYQSPDIAPDQSANVATQGQSERRSFRSLFDEDYLRRGRKLDGGILRNRNEERFVSDFRVRSSESKRFGEGDACMKMDISNWELDERLNWANRRAWVQSRALRLPFLAINMDFASVDSNDGVEMDCTLSAIVDIMGDAATAAADDSDDDMDFSSVDSNDGVEMDCTLSAIVDIMGDAATAAADADSDSDDNMDFSSVDCNDGVEMDCTLSAIDNIMGDAATAAADDSDDNMDFSSVDCNDGVEMDCTLSAIDDIMGDAATAAADDSDDDMDFSSVDSNDGVDVEGLCVRLSFLSLSYGRRGVKLMDVMDMDIDGEEDVMDCD